MESLKHTLKTLAIPLRLRIGRGPLRGLKWVLASGGKFFNGTYEREQTARFEASISSGSVVFDVGAHVGYYTAIASIRSGTRGRVYAFEPRPINLRILRCHLRVNRLGNVTVIPACVGESDGDARFDTRTGSGTGHLSEKGSLRVKVVSLDALVRSGTVPEPNVIKIDVEGAEMGVLTGAADVIQTARPTLFISTHGPDNHRAVTAFLEARNYSCEVLRDANAGDDKEVVALHSS